MPLPDPDELTLAAVYADRTLLLSWRPDQPGVRVVVAPVGDDPDVVVMRDQDRDTDELLRRVRRLAMRLPAPDRDDGR